MRPILEGCRRDCNPYFADIFAAIFAGLPNLARALLYPLQKYLQIIVAPQWGCGNMWTVKQGTTTQGAAMKKRQNRQIRRLEKAIDELMKIHIVVNLNQEERNDG